MQIGSILNILKINAASIILGIFVVIIFIVTCVDEKGFFSVKSIIRYYFSIFERPDDTLCVLDVGGKKVKKHYWVCPIIFNFAIPFILGILLGIINPINNTIVSFMSTVVSIWIAILLSLVAVIQSLAKEKLGDTYYTVVKQAYATVMFECSISVLTVILGFAYIILCPDKGVNAAACPTNIILIILSIIIYSLLFVLLLTMFMIFKKCNALLGQVIKANQVQKRDITLLEISKTLKKIEEKLNEEKKK